MSFEKDSTFARVIEDHLELKRKNTDLEREMPISGYHVDDPFQNHPLFKTEEQARIEDTLSGVEPELDPEKVLAWPTDNGDSAEPQDPEDTLWGRSRDFDWGDWPLLSAAAQRPEERREKVEGLSRIEPVRERIAGTAAVVHERRDSDDEIAVAEEDGAN